MSLLRPITPEDHAAVLAWNQSHVDLLAPLDEGRLVELLGWAETAAIICHDGREAGFVLTFVAGTAYDSSNYRWYADRHQRFVYLDRIVVDPAVQRSGLGTRVYDALELHARAIAPVLCLEVNLDPPNEPSLAFHRNRGYVEVDQQEYGGHLVSLMEKDLRGRG